MNPAVAFWVAYALVGVWMGYLVCRAADENPRYDDMNRAVIFLLVVVIWLPAVITVLYQRSKR